MTRLCITHIPEYATSDNVLSVDIAMKLKGRNEYNVAIEVDGSQHYSVNEPYVVMGETLARNVLLKARGWKVI